MEIEGGGGTDRFVWPPPSPQISHLPVEVASWSLSGRLDIPSSQSWDEHPRCQHTHTLCSCRPRHLTSIKKHATGSNGLRRRGMLSDILMVDLHDTKADIFHICLQERINSKALQHGSFNPASYVGTRDFLAMSKPRSSKISTSSSRIPSPPCPRPRQHLHLQHGIPFRGQTRNGPMDDAGTVERNMPEVDDSAHRFKH